MRTQDLPKQVREKLLALTDADVAGDHEVRAAQAAVTAAEKRAASASAARAPLIAVDVRLQREVAALDTEIATLQEERRTIALPIARGDVPAAEDIALCQRILEQQRVRDSRVMAGEQLAAELKVAQAALGHAVDAANDASVRLDETHDRVKLRIAQGA